MMGMGNQQRPPQPMGPQGGYMGARGNGVSVPGGMLSQMGPSQMPPIRRPMNPIPQAMPAMQVNPQQQALAQIIARQGLIR